MRSARYFLPLLLWEREEREIVRDLGPCYDFCSCRWCWNGWKGTRFSRRLRWRLAQILADLRNSWREKFTALKERGESGSESDRPEEKPGPKKSGSEKHTRKNIAPSSG